MQLISSYLASPKLGYFGAIKFYPISRCLIVL